MKWKALLVVLLLLVITSPVTASGGGWEPPPGPWDVYLASGYAVEGVRVVTYEFCPHACNIGGNGYALHTGHGPTAQACMDNAAGHPVPSLTYIGSSRLYGWGPDSHGEVGELACINWCCLPYTSVLWMA